MNNRPQLAFYHPNAKNTGCAVKFMITPANVMNEGSIDVTFANQLTAGNRVAKPIIFPTFDWNNAFTFKMNFDGICKFLQVLRGETESIDDDKGLYQRDETNHDTSRRLIFRHILEPITGYVMEGIVNNPDRDNEKSAHIVFSPSEGLGLSEVIAQSLYRVAFGDSPVFAD